MPELPDLQVFAHNLHSLFNGEKLSNLTIVKPGKLKDDVAELKKSIEGSKLDDVYRSGKELRFAFSNEAVLGIHLMLNGELYVFEDKNENKYTIAQFLFESGKGLALTDRQGLASIKLNPEDKKGIDALSGDLDVNYLKNALQTKTKIKSLLMDQDVIRGIGNAYADEILWEARISPMSVAKVIPVDKIVRLARAIKSVLQQAEKQIRKHQPEIIRGEVREFLLIHNKDKKESPTGKPIIIDKKSGRSTYYTDEQELYV